MKYDKFYEPDALPVIRPCSNTEGNGVIHGIQIRAVGGAHKDCDVIMLQVPFRAACDGVPVIPVKLGISILTGNLLGWGILPYLKISLHHISV